MMNHQTHIFFTAKFGEISNDDSNQNPLSSGNELVSLPFHSDISQFPYCISFKAWFVGYIEKSDNKIYFAIYLDDMQNREVVSGNKAKEIAVSSRSVFSSHWLHAVVSVSMPAMPFLSFCLCHFCSQSFLKPMLNYIFGSKNNFSTDNLEELKNIMYIAELDNGSLYAIISETSFFLWLC